MTVLDLITRRLPVGSIGARRWMISGIATVASTYALDFIAAGAGVLLLASTVLDGTSHPQLLFFLALTYVIWMAGLRVSLEANWKLIRETGTSSSIFSKGAHDLVRARTSNQAIHRLAADSGYVFFELAKEAPYYLGAFGAALLTDSITSNDAIIFLGGANLGAAAYEYGLARLVRAYLIAAPEPAYASFEHDWDPARYLAEYYARIERDEHETIRFFVDAMTHAARGQPVLLFGVGPTLHHVFLVAETASEIHLGDYLSCNLDDVRRWLQHDESAHDWRPFIRYTLECEGLAHPTETEIDVREDLVRRKTRELLLVDVRRDDPIEGGPMRKYATVISAYCADSATDCKDEWRKYMERIVGLVAPGGSFLTAALGNCDGYLVGGKRFPSPHLCQDDMRDVLAPYFDAADISIKACEFDGTSKKGYSSVILAYAKRKLA